MHQLRKLSRDGIGPALEKAEHYRLLNEPWEAESICRDVLAVDPGNQRAVIALVLALTDQFSRNAGEAAREAHDLLAGLSGEYERSYYAGIIHERQAKARIASRGPGAGYAAYESLRQAMSCFERAAELSPPGDDSSLLRWNTCVRILQRSNLGPAPDEPPVLLE